MARHVYHLDLDETKVRNANFAFLPGDPGRVPFIAQTLDENSREIAYNREFRTYICDFKGKNILVTSTGIGGPSTSIVVDELAKLGIKNFIRIGTTGAIQERINPGDVVITSGSVRLDGASKDYAPIQYPAVSNHEILGALVKAAKETNIPYHVGITASTDTFYSGQERYDSHSGYVIKRLQGTMEEWKKLNVLNYEMESSTLLTMASTFGLKAGVVCGVIVNRMKQENIDESLVGRVEKNTIDVAVKSLEILIADNFI